MVGFEENKGSNKAPLLFSQQTIIFPFSWGHKNIKKKSRLSLLLEGLIPLPNLVEQKQEEYQQHSQAWKTAFVSHRVGDRRTLQTQHLANGFLVDLQVNHDLAV